MKRVVKKIVPAILILCVILTLTGVINNALKWKDRSAVSRIYELKKDTIDVASFGSSHDFCTLNPSDLWDKYGIAMTSLSESGQTFDSTIVYMKETLKYHRPKLLIVEGYYLTSLLGKPNVNNGNLYRNTLNLKYSDNYVENINAVIDEEAVKPAKVSDFKKWLMLKFPVYHSRYSELEKADFRKYNLNDSGFNTAFTREEHDMSTVCQITKDAELTDVQKETIDKIADIAKDNGAELLIYIAPYALYEPHMKLYNGYEKYCNEQGIPFINFNKQELVDETGFDYSKDLRYENGAGEHLNYDGAVKITAYLCEYIHDNYDIADRRDDDKYAIYAKQSDYCKNYLNNHRLCECTNIYEYVNLLNPDTTELAVIVNSSDEKLIYKLENSSEKIQNQDDNDSEKHIFMEDITQKLINNGIYSTVDITGEKAYRLSDSVVIELNDKSENSTSVYIDKKYRDCSDADIVLISVDKEIGELVDLARFRLENGEFIREGQQE